MERAGNDDPVFAPHGIYRAQGDDQWVAVAVTTDAQWQALCGVLGEDATGLAGLAEPDRRARRRELDGLIERWTSARPPLDAQHALQAAGVPVHQVQNTREAFEDPQLAHRGHFQQVDHAAMGRTWVEGTRLRLSRTPGCAGSPPTLGEHTWQVLTEILGYDEERAAGLAAAGILE
jgi:benzylsuccinate CoA-transferase BbsF subunit